LSVELVCLFQGVRLLHCQAGNVRRMRYAAYITQEHLK